MQRQVPGFDKFTYWLIDYGLKSIIQMEKYAMRDGVVYIWVPSNVMMDAMQIDGVNDGHAQYILRDYPFWRPYSFDNFLYNANVVKL